MNKSMDDSLKSRCKDCREKIPADAKRCVHCGSYQDLRRLVNASGTVLALAVALITVMAFLVNNIIEIITPDSTNVTVSVLSAEQTGDFYLMATNTGSRHGSIAEVILYVCIAPGADSEGSSGKADCDGHLLSVKDRESGAGFLVPGESEQVVLFAPKGAGSFLKLARKQLGEMNVQQLKRKVIPLVYCPQLSVKIVDFRGVRSEERLEVDGFYCHLFITPWLAQMSE